MKSRADGVIIYKYDMIITPIQNNDVPRDWQGGGRPTWWWRLRRPEMWTKGYMQMSQTPNTGRIFIRSPPCEGGGGGDGVKVQHGVGRPCIRGRRSHNHLSHNIPSLGSCIATLPLVHYSTESIDLNFFGKYDIHHCCSKPLSLTTLVQEDRKIPWPAHDDSFTWFDDSAYH